MVESVVVIGRLSCAALLDIDKFFDHIRVSEVVHFATNLGFPPTPLALVAQLHTAERVIRRQGHYSMPHERVQELDPRGMHVQHQRRALYGV